MGFSLFFRDSTLDTKAGTINQTTDNKRDSKQVCEKQLARVHRDEVKEKQYSRFARKHTKGKEKKVQMTKGDVGVNFTSHLRMTLWTKP